MWVTIPLIGFPWTSGAPGFWPHSHVAKMVYVHVITPVAEDVFGKIPLDQCVKRPGSSAPLLRQDGRVGAQHPQAQELEASDATTRWLPWQALRFTSGAAKTPAACQMCHICDFPSGHSSPCRVKITLVAHGLFDDRPASHAANCWKM